MPTSAFSPTSTRTPSTPRDRITASLQTFVYGVERAAQELAGRASQSTASAWRDWLGRRRELRQAQSRPVLAEFYAWLQEVQWQVLPKSPVGRAIDYVLPGWDGLTRTARMAALAIDNNLSERMVRPVAIGRKNFLFWESDNGGKAAAIHYSVLASAKVNQVEPYAYVRDLLVQFTRGPPNDLSNLLPITGCRRSRKRAASGPADPPDVVRSALTSDQYNARARRPGGAAPAVAARAAKSDKKSSHNTEKNHCRRVEHASVWDDWSSLNP